MIRVVLNSYFSSSILLSDRVCWCVRSRICLCVCGVRVRVCVCTCMCVRACVRAWCGGCMWCMHLCACVRVLHSMCACLFVCYLLQLAGSTLPLWVMGLFKSKVCYKKRCTIQCYRPVWHAFILLRIAGFNGIHTLCPCLLCQLTIAKAMLPLIFYELNFLLFHKAPWGSASFNSESFVFSWLFSEFPESVSP